MDNFRDMTTCSIGNGKSIALRKDKWINDDAAENTYPHPHSFSHDENITLEKVLVATSIYDLFQLPLYTVAHQELQELQFELGNAHANNHHDSWNFQWSIANFLTKKVYRQLIDD
jgi:hypothetical protein